MASGLNTREYWNKKKAPVRTPFKNQWLVNTLIDRMPDSGTFKVLDVGCATGDLLFDLIETAREKKPNVTIIPCGIDISDVMITHCKKRFKDGEFFAVDMDDFIQMENTDVYEYIVSCHTMEHFMNVYPITEFLMQHTRHELLMVVPYRNSFACGEHVSFFDDETYKKYRCEVFKKGYELDKGLCIAYVFDCEVREDVA